MNKLRKMQVDMPLPVQVELFIDPDGTVVFADLAAEMIPVVQKLNPDHSLICDVPLVVKGRDRKASG